MKSTLHPNIPNWIHKNYFKNIKISSMSVICEKYGKVKINLLHLIWTVFYLKEFEKLEVEYISNYTFCNSIMYKIIYLIRFIDGNNSHN